MPLHNHLAQPPNHHQEDSPGLDSIDLDSPPDSPRLDFQDFHDSRLKRPAKRQKIGRFLAAKNAAHRTPPKNAAQDTARRRRESLGVFDPAHAPKIPRDSVQITAPTPQNRTKNPAHRESTRRQSPILANLVRESAPRIPSFESAPRIHAPRIPRQDSRCPRFAATTTKNSISPSL